MADASHDPFAGPALAARLPLTEAQREVWLTCELEPATTLAFNECGRLTLRGPLKVPALLASLQTLVDRHETLRSSFSPDGQWMVVAAAMQIDVQVVDVSSDPVGLIARCEEAELTTPFNLSTGPLIRWQLLRESDTLHHLVRTAHHVIFDGWSAWVLSSELSKLYSAAVEGREAGLPEPPPRYGDYAQTEREFVHSDEGQKHLDYWLTLLKDPPKPADIPHDLPRPAERTYAAKRVDIHFDATLVGRLRKLGAAQNASLVATTLAAFAATLHRQTGTQDVIVALAAAGQSFHQYNGLVGHAVNLLPLRFALKPDQPFTDLLAQTRTSVLDAFDHQGASFGGIVPQLQFERDASRPPLITAVFNIDVRSGDVIFSGLETRYFVLERKAEVFDLFINMVDNGRDLVLEASYNGAVFSEAAIRERMAEYERILRALCDAPGTPLAQLPLIDDRVLARLDGWNQTAQPVPDQSLHALVLDTVRRKPSATAVLFGEQKQSYAELGAVSARIAQALRQQGAAAGADVAVCLERGLLVPAALVGVLRSGAGYVALDPIFPTERVRSIVEQSGVRLLLTQTALRAQFAGLPCTVLCVEDLLAGDAAIDTAALDAVPVAASDASYIVFTSGSTGQPKGVVLTHGGVVNCLTSLRREPGLSEDETALAVATLAFDFSVYEIFLPLLVGARLVMADLETTADGNRLKALIAQHDISSIHATPATMRLLQSAGWEGKPTLRMVFGGEALPRDLIAWLKPRIREIWNIYGPTETTITSNLCRITSAEGVIPVGPPINNVICRVLDGAKQLLPPGVAGELYIGGAGVGRGYLNQPAMTAERFIDDPYLPGGRLYRSGDLARWLPDGQIEILGRIDSQVKLRGYRIELGEIEYKLAQHPAVAESLVMVLERSPGDQRLVAYVSLRDGAEEPTASMLRSLLREQLPSYMVPQQFVTLTPLPRLPNGKLDRKKLPNPFAQQQAAAETRLPPRTLAEKSLAAIWSEVLGVQDISIDDRFADLGGHSLLAVQVAAKMQAAFGRKPVLRSVLMDPLSVVAAQLPGGEALAKATASPAPSPMITPPASKTSLPPLPPTLLTDIQIPARQSQGKSSSWLGKLLGK